MPARKITKDEIKAMKEMYSYCKNYSAVAQKFECSPATVKKYVSIEDSIVMPQIDTTSFDDIEDFANIPLEEIDK